VTGYTAYLLAIDFFANYTGKVPAGFSSFGLFAIGENFDQAIKHHIIALVATVSIPLHRVVYNASVSFFCGGMAETCEDEWPCEPDGKFQLPSLFY